MKLVLKILALPVLFVVKVICVLGNLLTNVVSYVIGILLLVIGGSAIYCIVKALWQSLLILVVLGITTIAFIIRPRWMPHGNSKTSFFPVWRCKDSAIWFAWNMGCPLLHRSHIRNARKELFIPRSVPSVTNYVMRLTRC